jgi:hypothetical protein
VAEGPVGISAVTEEARPFSFTPGQCVFLDVPRKAVIAAPRADETMEQTIVHDIRDENTLWISADPEAENGT